jgi:hypothetical protein
LHVFVGDGAAELGGGAELVAGLNTSKTCEVTLPVSKYGPAPVISEGRLNSSTSIAPAVSR